MLLPASERCVLQGIVGTMPWVAMGFSTLYLQLLGFSDLNSAILVAIFSFGCSLGSFGGGYIGEAFAWCFQPSWTPLRGRQAEDTQVSSRPFTQVTHLL